MLLLAGAMAVQGLAGLQILGVLKPLMQKQQQLVNEGKHVAEVSQNLVRDVKPGLALTSERARDLAATTASRFRARKQDAENLAEPIRRLRRPPRAKPRTTQRQDEV